MICNEYIGLYFYSAVFQGNMALIALLGVFVVFKRQELTSEIQGRDNAIVTFCQNYLDLVLSESKHVPITYSNVDTLPNDLIEMSKNQNLNETIRDRAKALHDHPEFTARISERKVLIEKRSGIVTLMASPFIWILSIIVASLVLLPIVHSIHTKTPLLELLLIGTTIIINFWALVVTKRFVWKMLKD